MAKPKKKSIPKGSPKRTSYVLHPADRERIGKLQTVYGKKTEVEISETQALRFALRDACIHNGVEERAGGSVPPPAGDS